MGTDYVMASRRNIRTTIAYWTGKIEKTVLKGTLM